MSQPIRHDFSPNTKRILSERAGQCCSHPQCGKTTRGPSADPTSSSGDGVAAHIVSASPTGGARCIPTWTKEQRTSIDNGIWLCGSHGRTIDGDELNYPIELLHAWKNLHEKKIKLATDGRWIGSGMITLVDVENIGPFVSKNCIILEGRNLFIGGNSTGKTVLSDMISGVKIRKNIERWICKSKIGTLRVETVVSTIERWDVELRDELIIRNDGEVFPNIISPICVLYARDRFYAPVLTSDEENRDERLLQAFSDFLSVPVVELKTIIKQLESNPGKFIYGLRLDDCKLEIQYDRESHWFPFGSLSSSEQQICLIEIMFKLATYYSKKSPTLFIIDETAFESVDDGGKRDMLEKLLNTELNVQVIINLCRWEFVRNFHNWNVLQFKFVNNRKDIQILPLCQHKTLVSTK